VRVILFLNNWGGWQIARWLRTRGDEVVALVLHPDSDQRFAPQIADVLALPPERIWRGPDLRRPETVAALAALRPDIGVSGWFGYVFKPDLLEIFASGVVNLHAAYLPFNRGWHTNVWPILDGSPAGVTLHYIDAGIDTGDLIAQRQVPVSPIDTGGSLHQKLTTEMIAIFKETWPGIVEGRVERTPQDHSRATKHKRSDLAGLDRIELDREYIARELLNLLRARTYPPYPAAYVEESQRTYVRVHLSAEGLPGEPIDLDRRYVARDLLDVLRAPIGSSSSAYFLHDGGRVFVRTQLIPETDIDPSGNPAWITSSV
jgi:methionyl-tRNA formyltransferase